MDKETRNLLFNTTQAIRRLLEEEFSLQLEGTFDVHADGRVAEQPGSQLSASERLVRCRIVEAIQHRLAVGESAAEAVRGFQSEAVFTFLNRLAALKMMEARALVLPCVSQGDQSQGFKEFSGLAPGLIELQDKGYRLYLECLFDEIGREVGVLFDRTDAASQLWPRRKALEAVLAKLNTPELAGVWAEDETIGWIYQYYNDPQERKQMREESSAPRNSRELAVRNQFFTPRYVVEFLTDNTLGRIWYEMTKGQTRLKDQCRYLVRRPTETFLAEGQSLQASPPATDNCSQENLLRQPVHIPHRPLKDPREIRMIDPACGSMHFGLYAFDLFTVIYEEAWETAHGADAATKSAKTFAPFVTFAASFADKAAFLREVPRLIVEHNIHGIDIDPRAAQIAGLALWLRAQRAWQALGLKPSDRPPIRRSNVVCAEPMPGEKELLREFVEQQFPQGERSLFQSFLENVWDKMRLAGEAGSLLKIEEEIRSAIENAREAWRKLSARPMELFSASELNRISSAPELTGMDQAVSSLAAGRNQVGADFWEHLEERIYAALRDYAEQADNDGGFQRRLFAEDAARGFAFIDVCRKRYDVALMNPPFGEATKAVYEQDIPLAAGSTREIASLFLSRCGEQLAKGGRIGMLATRLLMFLDQLEEWRKATLASRNFSLVADLGYGVLDAVVEPAAFVVSAEEERIGTFYRLLSSPDKEVALLAAVASPKVDRDIFTVVNRWGQIPGNRIAYWAPNHWLDLFAHSSIEEYAIVSKGLETGEDERFLRLAVEVPSQEVDGRWRRYAKGGDYQPVAGNYELVVDFNLFPVARRTTDSSLYGNFGVTYTQRTTSFLSFRALPPGGVFSPGGPGIIPRSSERPELLLSYLGSRPIGALVELCVGSGDSAVRGSAARNYTTGIIKGLPCLIDQIGEPETAQIREAIRERFACIQRHQLEVDELSPTFQGARWQPQLTLVEAAYREAKYFISDALGVLRADWLVDGLWRDAFRFSEADCKFLDDDFARHPTQCGGGRIPENFWANPNLPSDHDDDADVPVVGVSRQLMKRSHIVHPELESLALRFNCRLEELSNEPQFHDLLVNGGGAVCEFLISFGVGCAFGRWDIRYATGEQAAPELPDPFAPLPVCPPGQLQNAQGLPARPEDVPVAYPVRIPWDGILVDDPNHPLDLEGRVREVIEIIWSGQTGGPTAESIEHEACEILGVKSLRDYFRKPTGFFADHLKRYSKSRRQAPIYWPLSTASGSYTVWLYYHRLTSDTLFTVLRDYLGPKLEFEERRAFQLRQEAGTTPAPSQRCNLGEAEELVEDLRAFKAELERVAPLLRPNLNDGVIINYAPLWRMIGLPKWRKDCQAIWKELAKGDYDWAHLAMHLWPERVVPKCATDRSLAIAHGLEEVFWQEDPEKPGKWIARKVTETEVRGLIAERTSAAVKAAVESLVGATSNEGAPRRGRKGAKA